MFCSAVLLWGTLGMSEALFPFTLEALHSASNFKVTTKMSPEYVSQTCVGNLVKHHNYSISLVFPAPVSLMVCPTLGG